MVITIIIVSVGKRTNLVYHQLKAEKAHYRVASTKRTPHKINQLNTG